VFVERRVSRGQRGGEDRLGVWGESGDFTWYYRRRRRKDAAVRKKSPMPINGTGVFQVNARELAVVIRTADLQALSLRSIPPEFAALISLSLLVFSELGLS